MIVDFCRVSSKKYKINYWIRVIGIISISSGNLDIKSKYSKIKRDFHEDVSINEMMGIYWISIIISNVKIPCHNKDII